jgi:hypothetical protein
MAARHEMLRDPQSAMRHPVDIGREEFRDYRNPHVHQG